MHSNDYFVALSSDQGVQITKTGFYESLLCKGSIRLQELLSRNDELRIKDARLKSSHIFCECQDISLVLLIRNLINKLHGFRLLRIKRFVICHDLFHCFAVLLHQPLLSLVESNHALAIAHIQLRLYYDLLVFHDLSTFSRDSHLLFAAVHCELLSTGVDPKKELADGAAQSIALLLVEVVGCLSRVLEIKHCHGAARELTVDGATLFVVVQRVLLDPKDESWLRHS